MEYYLSDKEFMHAALQGKYLTAEQMAKCKQSQKNVAKHKDKMLHELALYHNLITVEQMDLLYKETRKKNKSLAIGNYEIKSILGEGGLGVVYLAKQLSMKRNVALKVLYRKWVQDEEFRKRFLLEARIVGKLSHTNLIQVFDIGYDKGHYYFSMEHVPGRTLEQMIMKDGYISLEKAIENTFQLLDALNYIWKKNLVHRDIKPSNIIVNKEQIAKLGDFGFVKSKMDEQLVQNEDFVLGTPDYMSPEQAMGKSDLDYRSDIYSLGATMYHMITGSAPYDGSESVIIRQHIKAAIPSPLTIRSSIPPGVCQIIEKMMAKEPHDRYQSYESLKRDLLLVKEGNSPKAKRLDINKSTIARQDFFGLPAQMHKLEQEIKRLKYREVYYQILIVILCSTLVIILLLAG
ncbi:serine/threonine protein kinase [Candidatus Uabimicrobium sp. HlEnr_7]|uniref:serine/threonine protein kinase n=1 Tax=Candidatus Uabimicrobium helgolandensis TaxID=3095367 RepID=UPI003555C57F